MLLKGRLRHLNSVYFDDRDILHIESAVRKIACGMSKRLGVLNEYAETLLVRYSNMVVKISIPHLKQILIEANNTHTHNINERSFEFVTSAGLEEISRSYGLDEVGLLQLSMSNDSRIDDSEKRQLLFGVVRKCQHPHPVLIVSEGKRVVAPHIEKNVTMAANGSTEFIAWQPGYSTPKPPGLEYFCDQKRSSGEAVWKIVGLILKDLKTKESINGFRLKSYGSVMNKLFYRGKGLSDLFATTISTQNDLDKLISSLEVVGAKLVERSQNGNGCEVLKYVRLLQVTVVKSSREEDDDENVMKHVFVFPVYYEIVFEVSATLVSHEIYELKRLQCSLTEEQKEILLGHGFCIDEIPSEYDPVSRTKKNYVALDHSHKKPTLISYICIFLALGWFPIFPLILFIIFQPYLWQNYFQYFFYLFLFFCLLSLIFPIQRDIQPQILLNFGIWMANVCTSYFSLKIEFEDISLIEKSFPSLFAVEPHGVLPVTLYWGTLNILKNHKFLCCLSSSILSIPLMKHFLTWSGAITANKYHMIKYLKQGYSLNICPGGVQEVRYLNTSKSNDNTSKEIVMFLKSRIGLTKLALEQGCCLIPCITFGLHQIYDYYVLDWELLVTIGRRLGFFPMIFLGLGGIPFAQPKPSPLILVIGKPIHLPKIDQPTQEEVRKYHEIFLDEMRRIFEENKHEKGMGEYTLRIE